MREPSVQARQTFRERLPAPSAASHVSCTWIQRIPAEQLAEADSATKATELIESEVTAPLAGCRRRDPVAAATLDALRREPRIDMRRIAADLFVSDRQLRRRCRTAFGYSAKTMQRVLRFQRFLALNASNPGETEDGVGRLAWAAGYADQP